MLFLVGSAFLQSDPPSSLDPRGPAAASIAELWWVMFFLGTVIFLLVVGLLAYGIWGRRESPESTTDHTDQGNRWIMLGGIIMPSIVLAIVFGFTIRSSLLTANETGTGTLIIEVVGRRWWWEVNYPDQGVITANEIHIPTHTSVEMRLRSGDIIHSLWVPQLNGKMDLIPGQDNTLILRADETGVFRGECAEFCGLQHARMQFLVHAQTPEDFELWISTQQQDAAQPETALAQQGQEVFIAAGCVYCHTVRGLDSGDVDRSSVDLGPDLTHLASRSTLAAGIRENNRGNLSGWISNPHGIKPGVLMPATLLTGEELQAILAYLETLE